jgi:predicted metal-dependent peptidase
MTESDKFPIKEFFDWKHRFSEDKSPEGEYQANRVSQARGKLYVDMPFFGYILGHFEIIPVNDDRIQGFSIDIRYLYFNTRYTEKLTIERIKGVLMHLVMHLIMKHIERGKGRNADVWSISADISSDLMIEEVKKEQPFDWLTNSIKEIPEEYQNISTEEIYKFLYEDAQSDQLGSSQQDDENNSGDSNDENDNQNDDNEFSSDIIDDLREKSGVGAACNFNETIKEMEDVLNSPLGELQKDRFLGILRSAYETAKERGSIPAKMRFFIEGLLNPKIPWYVILENYIQKTIMVDWKWNPPNKRLISSGFHIPSPDKEFLNVVIAVDTSGSISSDELNSFISEVFGILTTLTRIKLTLIDCDAEVKQISVYEDGESISGEPLPWENREFIGRGGTDFVPVFQYIEDEGTDPDLFIYFTDGYGRFPKENEFNMNYPILWVMTTDVIAPFGQTIQHDDYISAS